MAATSLEGPDAPLTLTTLGAASLVVPVNGDAPIFIGPGKPIALLSYLSAAPGRTATREHLIDLLWADVDPDDGRHALRQTVWYIRQRVHADVLSATRDSVTIDDSIDSDRQQFLHAVQRQDHEAAVALYQGDFLPSIALPGGLEFEHWVDLERQRLRAAFLRCGEAVARRWLAAGRVRDAVALGRRMRDADPSIEGSWRILLDSLLSANDPVSAATEADALAKWLDADGREPEPATRAMLRSAHSASAETAPSGKPRAITTELVGRAAEFSALVGAWDEARAHGARHIHLVAPAGVGKTRLVTDFIARLRARRARIAFIAAHPGDRAIQCASLGDIATALCGLSGAAAISHGAARVMVALHPALSSTFAAEPDTAQGDEAIRRRTIALQEVVAAVCDEGLVALVVDDVHWMDDGSRRILMSMLQRLREERLLVVTTSRPRYPFSGPPHMRQLDLAPLSPAQVAALVATLGTLPRDAWATRFADNLHAATGGTPLLLLETLQLLTERRVVTLDGSAWSVHDETALREVFANGGALRMRLARLADAERRALVLLAAAGVPLTNEIVAQTGQGASLELLEQRGLVVRATNAWELAHDAVGELVVDVAPAEELRDAHACIARAHLLAGTADPAPLFRAGRHFALAGDWASFDRAFVRWVGVLRREGEARSPRALAEDFAGPDADATTRAGLVRALPLHLRFARRRVVGAIAASFLGALLLAEFSFYTPVAAPPKEVTLLAIYADSGADTSTIVLDLRHDDLARHKVLPLTDGRRANIPVPPSLSTRASNISPDGTRWAFTHVYADSGGIDIGAMDMKSGRLRRITTGSSDDESPTWSPDGKQIAMSTGRFNPHHFSDIAIVDSLTGAARQLTSGDAVDGAPSWSPAGPTIAFSRRRAGGDSIRLCTIAVDGSNLDCFGDITYSYTPIGWYDHQRVVVAAHRVGSSIGGFDIALADIRTHEIQPLPTSLQAFWGQLSPDGRWVLCQCRVSAAAVRRWYVFPIDQPDLAREVVRDALRDKEFWLSWLAAPRQERFAAAIRIEPPSGGIPMGVATLLGATAFDTDGMPVPVPALKWESLDTARATMDAQTGRIVAKGTGTVRVRVSAGGWVSGEAMLRIVPATWNVMITERWNDGIDKTWVPYGEPRPAIVFETRLGNALFHNGDGSFLSGVYSARSFEGDGGIGVEVVASARIDSLQWQSLSVALLPDIAPDILARWDHRTDENPLERSVGGPRCQVGVPYGEGPQSLASMGITSRDALARVPLPPGLRTGASFRARVQLFPDGRCGVAIDGRQVALIGAPARVTSRYRVVVSGKSEWTRILVGRLDVWQGVRRDVDWR